MRVLLIAYEGKVKGAKEPFEKVPEDNPLPVLVGAGELIPGLEEVLKDAKEGSEIEVEIPPEKAYGRRDPEKIAVISLSEFKKRGITPYPGLVIEADGARGRVLSVSGGRVQVDFNHELAGKTLVYKVKVLKELKANTDIAKALFKRYFGREPEKVEEVDGGVRITYTPKNIERDTMSKVLLVSKLLKVVETVYVEEVYRRQGAV